MKKYIIQAYNNSVFLLTTGHSVLFYTDLNKKPKEIHMMDVPPCENEEDVEREYVRSGIKYMTPKETKDFWDMVKKDDKPWGYFGITKDNYSVEHNAREIKLLKSYEKENRELKKSGKPIKYNPEKLRVEIWEREKNLEHYRNELQELYEKGIALKDKNNAACGRV